MPANRRNSIGAMEYNVSVSRRSSIGQQMKPDGCMGLSMVSSDNPALPNPYRRRATMGFDDSSSENTTNKNKSTENNKNVEKSKSRRTIPSSMDPRCLLPAKPETQAPAQGSTLTRSGSRGNLSAQQMASAVRRVRSGNDLLGRRAPGGGQPRRSGSRRNMRSTSSPSISIDEEEDYLDSTINSKNHKNYNWSDDVSLDDDSVVAEAEASGALRRATAHYSKRSVLSRAKSDRNVNLGVDDTSSLALSAVRRSGSKSNLDKLFGGSKESSSSTSREERTIASSTSREERTVTSSTSGSNHSGESTSKRPSKTKLIGSLDDERSHTNRSIARSNSRTKLLSRCSSGSSPKSPKRSSSKTKLAAEVEQPPPKAITTSPRSTKRSSSKSKLATEVEEVLSTTTTAKSPKRSGSKSNSSRMEEEQLATKEMTLPPAPPAAVVINHPAPSSPFVSPSWTCTCGYTLGLCMKFCGMCATPQHWTCGIADCGFDQNLAIFKYCGGCGGPRCELHQPKQQIQKTPGEAERDSDDGANENKMGIANLVDSPTAVVSVVDLGYE